MNDYRAAWNFIKQCLIKRLDMPTIPVSTTLGRERWPMLPNTFVSTSVLLIYSLCYSSNDKSPYYARLFLALQTQPTHLLEDDHDDTDLSIKSCLEKSLWSTYVESSSKQTPVEIPVWYQDVTGVLNNIVLYACSIILVECAPLQCFRLYHLSLVEKVAMEYIYKALAPGYVKQSKLPTAPESVSLLEWNWWGSPPLIRLQGTK